MTKLSTLFILTVVVLGCGTLGKPSPGDRDHLLGWYRLEDRNVVIPVFKSDGGYYTVSWPGAEVPLKECPEGLEWAPAPSSMTGTKIMYDKQSTSPYSIVIHDALAEQVSGWESDKKRSLAKIDEPTGLLDPTTKPPHSMDDFLGRYVLAWMPVAGIEVRKDGDKYLVTWQGMKEPGQWEPQGSRSTVALAPLSDRLGFTVCDPDTECVLVYSDTQKRYELVTGKTEAGAIAIPLARVAPDTLFRTEANFTPPVAIGIPSWH